VSLLAPGEAAPDFEAPDQNGRAVRLADYRGKWVVLYFYPADETPGCTVESCAFRDGIEDFEAAGAVVLGVSTQDASSHDAFARRHRLPFTLLADTDKVVCKAYGALGLFGYAKRITYLLDPEGKVARVWPSVSPRAHAGEVLEALAAARSEAGPPKP